jgi:mannose-1-phosphate guanylyltransferase
LCDVNLKELAQFDPGILVANREVTDKARIDDIRIYPDAVAASPGASIDYAVIERPTELPWCRSTWFGKTSAVGTRCILSATRTATATHIAAT